jgi:hypothetical protein
MQAVAVSSGAHRAGAVDGFGLRRKLRRGESWILAEPAPQQAAFPLTAARASIFPVSAPQRSRSLPAATSSLTPAEQSRRSAALAAALQRASRSRLARVRPVRVRPARPKPVRPTPAIQITERLTPEELTPERLAPERRLAPEELTPEHTKHPVRLTHAIPVRATPARTVFPPAGKRRR